MNQTKLRVDQGVLYLAGEVSFKTVKALSGELVLILNKDVAQLDCSGVGRVDSSALALLLYALKLAAQQHSSLELIHLPEALNKLAKLYAVELLLAPASTS